MNERERKLNQWESLAEEQIRAAQEEGQFDHLPGLGQPIPDIDEPHDELWWVRQKLKRERLSALPPALAIKLDVERTLTRVGALSREPEVRRELAALNDRIRTAQRNALWGPSFDVMPLDVEEVVAKWRSSRYRQQSAGEGPRGGNSML
jgi:hypothetical protein